MKNNILRGIIISLILTFGLLLIFSAILTYTNVRENTMGTVITIVTVISSITGGFFTTKKIKKNGFLNGALVGISYITIIYVVSGICGGGFAFSAYRLTVIVGVVIAGMLGGIVGVNI